MTTRSKKHFQEGSAEPQIPRLPPDFLSGLVASVNFVRLSLKKAAYVAVDESSVVGNPEFARDDKRGGQRLPPQPLPRDGRSCRRVSAIFIALVGRRPMTTRSKKHFQEGSPKLQIPRLRSGAALSIPR
jgi:hypothetical protein